MKFCIIGSGCFSAVHFIDYLLLKGHSVIGFNRSKLPHPVFLTKRICDSHDFVFHQLDLNNDLDQMMDIIETEKPEYIVNFAAQGMVAQSWNKPEQWYQTNTLSMVKLHDKLRTYNNLKKYVQISTPEVYGNCEGCVKESFFYQPSTPYAISKAAADMNLSAFQRAYNFPVTFTRAANYYGPMQQLYRIIPRTILCFLLGKTLYLDGGGHSIRSFIHIKDVAEATYKVAIQGTIGHVYHLASPEQYTIRHVVETISKHLNVRFSDFVKISDERLGKDHTYSLDCSKANRELDWAPHVSFNEGLNETIHWVKSNIDVLKNQSLEYIHKK